MVDPNALKRIAASMALLVLAGCGSSPRPPDGPPSPSTPTPVAPAPSPLTGAWTGMFDVSSCVGSTEWCRITNAEPFTLNLDASLSGVAEVELWRRHPLALDITQSLNSDGSTTLKGVSGLTQPKIEVEIQLQGSESSGLAGFVTYTISGGLPGGPPAGVATRTGPILFIRPVSIVRAGPLQGMWRGYANRSACSGDCQYVRETTEVSFWFSQHGSSVSGFFRWPHGREDAFEGTVTGQEFTFVHEHSVPVCLTTYDGTALCQDSFEFRGTVDSLGRMRGTIQRRQVGNDYYNGPFSWTATLELVGVVRVTPSLDGR